MSQQTYKKLRFCSNYRTIIESQLSQYYDQVKVIRITTSSADIINKLINFTSLEEVIIHYNTNNISLPKSCIKLNILNCTNIFFFSFIKENYVKYLYIESKLYFDIDNILDLIKISFPSLEYIYHKVINPIKYQYGRIIIQ